MSTHVQSPPPRKQSLVPSLDGFTTYSRRPSAANGFVDALRKVSVASAAPSITPSQDNEINTEELFVKHTVAEVRGIQKKLQHEADAKQGELRLMVGERYRDLLQASASIIAMNKSSEHVLEVLEESHDIVDDNSNASRPKRAMQTNKDDTQLRSMKALAAHIRLLLDTPEHLWRLIEQKRYLHATWLFLLARVVHRSLANNDPDEDDILRNQGIDVMDQFPLAQRQWDTISHFRSQIAHKAVLSLRETSHSPEDICATLLTLHLIDSKPLLDALSAFTAQRTRALQQVLTKKLDPLANGEANLSGKLTATRRKAHAHSVRLSVRNVLDLLSNTVGAARTVFQNKSDAMSSLMSRTLQFIDNEGPTSDTGELSEKLSLSTPSLLNHLSPASHAPLPPAIRTYKPYLDLSSSSVTVTPQDLTNKLNTWFRAALQQFSTTCEKWIAELDSARQIWSLLMWFRKSVAASDALDEGEQAQLSSAMEAVCKARIVVIWTGALKDMGEAFRNNLQKALAQVSSDDRPTELVFSALPHLDSGNSSVPATAFVEYKQIIQKQISGRSPLLSLIVSPLEMRTKRINTELERMAQDKSAESIVSDLSRLYRTESASLHGAVLASANAETDLLVADSADSPTFQLAFMARLLEELITWSDGDPGSDRGFAPSARKLHARINDALIDNVAKRAKATYQTMFQEEFASYALFPRDGTSLTSVSGALWSALHTVLSFLQEMQVPNNASTPDSRVTRILDELAKSVSQVDLSSIAQLPYERDLRLLRHVSQLWSGNNSADGDHNVQSSVDETVADCLRVQLWLDPLLPPAYHSPHYQPGLLRLGQPPVDQKLQPLMEVTKPLPRFPLLLVGSAVQ